MDSVSIRAPPCERGELRRFIVERQQKGYQSAPRLVSGADHANGTVNCLDNLEIPLALRCKQMPHQTLGSAAKTPLFDRHFWFAHSCVLTKSKELPSPRAP